MQIPGDDCILQSRDLRQPGELEQLERPLCPFPSIRSIQTWNRTGTRNLNPEQISDSDLDALALQVDEQLTELQSAPLAEVRVRGVARDPKTRLPAAPRQRALIEKAAGEPFESFWDKYKRHARRDLCLPGGYLHTQWEKWRDLSSKNAVKMSLASLTGMGISTANIPVLAVPATVFLLNAVANIATLADLIESTSPESA